MINFNQYKSRISQVGKRIYILFNDSVYFKLNDIIEDESSLDELSSNHARLSDALNMILDEFRKERDMLTEEEYEEMEDAIDEVEDIFNKLDDKLYAIDNIVFSFNKLWDDLNSPKYLDGIDDSIQKLPESVSYIKINRLR